METTPRVVRDCNTCRRHRQAVELECQKFTTWDHLASRFISWFEECLSTPELKHWELDTGAQKTAHILSLPKK